MRACDRYSSVAKPYGFIECKDELNSVFLEFMYVSLTLRPELNRVSCI